MQYAQAESSSDRTALFVHCACMLVVALDIPIISNATMGLAGLVALQQLLRARIVGNDFLWRGALLFAAVMSYYMICVSHGFLEAPRAVAFSIVIMAGFVAGYTVSRSCNGRHSHDAVAGLLFGIIGSVVVASLTAIRGATMVAEVLARDEVHVPTLWTGEMVTATTLGAQAALGMCIFSATLFWPNGRGLLLRLTLGACAILGIYANVVLQNRSPFISGAAALTVGIALLAGSRRLSTIRKLALLVALGVFAALAIVKLWGRVSALGAYQRFEAEGLGTVRYQVWIQVFTHLLDNFTGGRVTRIDATYAHNLWLDIGWDSGPLPFALMALFHISVAVPVVAIMRRGDLLARLVIAGAGIAFGAAAMAEPAMSFSMSYASLLFYYCGVVIGLRPASTLRVDFSRSSAAILD